MKRLLLLNFLLIGTACIRLTAQPWSQQPYLGIDSKKNLQYYDPNVRAIKKVFPVMLYSFPDYKESDPTPAAFWAEAYQWGFNLVYNWQTKAAQINVLANCNKFNKLCVVNGEYSTLRSGIFSFPDEPMSNAALTRSDFAGIKSKWPDTVLSYLNFDIASYYNRREKGAPNGFTSVVKLPNGNTTSYTQFAAEADILAFDYYPYGAEGVIHTNALNRVSTSTVSVGEFTALMKRQWPGKPIWAGIQSLWYYPWTGSFYKGRVITDTIMRQLAFDAIINGADGVYFWGHGSMHLYRDSTGYEFLHGLQGTIWKHVLYITKELKELQEVNYSHILLEDNLLSSSGKSNGVEYNFKKATGSKTYYAFIVNKAKTSVTVKIQIPPGLKIVSGSMQSIGRYSMPAISGIAAATIRDYRNTKAIGSIANGGTSFYTTLYGYGTNIIAMELVKR